MNSKNRQRGFGVIGAIFIVVVLALLGAGVATVSSLQQRQSGLDTETTRAIQSARAGLEWGMYQTKGASGGASAPPCFATKSIAMTGTLDGFVASVTCTMATTNDGPSATSTYTIDSTACNRPNGGACPNTDAYVAKDATYVEKHLQSKTSAVTCSAGTSWDGAACATSSGSSCAGGSTGVMPGTEATQSIPAQSCPAGSTGTTGTETRTYQCTGPSTGAWGPWVHTAEPSCGPVTPSYCPNLSTWYAAGSMPAGYYKNATDGGCYPTPVCQGGTSWNGSSNACVNSCPAGTAWNGSSCISACAAGGSWNGSACAGPAPTVTATIDQTVMEVGDYANVNWEATPPEATVRVTCSGATDDGIVADGYPADSTQWGGAWTSPTRGGALNCKVVARNGYGSAEADVSAMVNEPAPPTITASFSPSVINFASPSNAGYKQTGYTTLTWDASSSPVDIACTGTGTGAFGAYGWDATYTTYGYVPGYNRTGQWKTGSDTLQLEEGANVSCVLTTTNSMGSTSTTVTASAVPNTSPPAIDSSINLNNGGVYNVGDTLNYVWTASAGSQVTSPQGGCVDGAGNVFYSIDTTQSPFVGTGFGTLWTLPSGSPMTISCTLVATNAYGTATTTATAVIAGGKPTLSVYFNPDPATTKQWTYFGWNATSDSTVSVSCTGTSDFWSFNPGWQAGYSGSGLPSSSWQGLTPETDGSITCTATATNAYGSTTMSATVQASTPPYPPVVVATMTPTTAAPVTGGLNTNLTFSWTVTGGTPTAMTTTCTRPVGADVNVNDMIGDGVYYPSVMTASAAPGVVSCTVTASNQFGSSSDTKTATIVCPSNTTWDSASSTCMSTLPPVFTVILYQSQDQINNSSSSDNSVSYSVDYMTSSGSSVVGTCDGTGLAAPTIEGQHQMNLTNQTTPGTWYTATTGTNFYNTGVTCKFTATNSAGSTTVAPVPTCSDLQSLAASWDPINHVCVR